MEMGRVGFEPTRAKCPGDFKSPASTVPPPAHCACILHTLPILVQMIMVLAEREVSSST